MDLSFTPEEQAFREEIRAWVKDHLPSDISHKVHNALELTREDHQRWAKILGGKGWLGYGWPKEFGGPGWTSIQRHLFEEETALAGAPPGAPVILLDHQPKRARDAAERGVALQLSGHTHGGMIRGLDRIVARANAGYVSGEYAVGDMTLYVSNGTGLWPGFALRLGPASEMTRITLHAKR